MKVFIQWQSCRKSGGGKETVEDNEYFYYNSVYNMLEMFSKYIKALFFAKELVP